MHKPTIEEILTPKLKTRPRISEREDGTFFTDHHVRTAHVKFKTSKTELAPRKDEHQKILPNWGEHFTSLSTKIVRRPKPLFSTRYKGELP